MTFGCAVVECKNRQPSNEFTFHRFPFKNPEQLKLWLRQMNLGMWTPSPHDRICSKHFESHMFYMAKNNKRYLKKDAVPILFMELPKYFQNTKLTNGLRKKLPVKSSATTPSTNVGSSRDISDSEELVDETGTEEILQSVLLTNKNSVGDEGLKDTPEMQKMRRLLFIEVRKFKEKNLKVRYLLRKIRRCKKTNSELKETINQLKSRVCVVIL